MDVIISACNEREFALACSTVAKTGGVIYSDGFEPLDRRGHEVLVTPKLRKNVTGDFSWLRKRMAPARDVLLLDADTYVYRIPEFQSGKINCPVLSSGKSNIYTSNVMYIPEKAGEKLLEYFDFYEKLRGKVFSEYQDPFLSQAIKRLQLDVVDISGMVYYHKKGGTPPTESSEFNFAHHNHGNPNLSNE